MDDKVVKVKVKKEKTKHCCSTMSRISHHGEYLNATPLGNCWLQDALITSAQTGFEIDYLVEIGASVEINSDAFEGLAKVYNRLHNNRLPTATADRRIEVHRKRLTDAYFLFIYLELSQRYGVENYQIIENSDLDQTIRQYCYLCTGFKDPNILGN